MSQFWDSGPVTIAGLIAGTFKDILSMSQWYWDQACALLPLGLGFLCPVNISRIFSVLGLGPIKTGILALLP